MYTVYNNLTSTFIKFGSLFKLYAFGFPVKKFVYGVLKDPYSAQNNGRLNSIFNYYKSNPNIMFFGSRSDKILLNFILQKDYKTFIRKCPHFFMLVLKSNVPVHVIPSAEIFNPSDFKSGDAIVAATGQRVEFKTFTYLHDNRSLYLAKQFGGNKTNSSLCLSVLYKSVLPATEPLYITPGGFKASLLSLGFDISKVDVFSVEHLQSFLLEPTYLVKFFKVLDVSYSSYVDQHFNMLESTLKDVISFSTQRDIQKKAKAYLAGLQAERLDYFNGTSLNNRTRTVTKFTNMRDIPDLETLAQIDAEIAEAEDECPEDIMSTVVSWFDSKN